MKPRSDGEETKDVISDLEIIEATRSTIEDLDPIQLDDENHSKKAFIDHKLQDPDMSGIPKEIATHRLNVDPFYPQCHKFFGILKKDNELQWNVECINALKELKAYLSSLPLLAKAEPGERLLIYLAVSDVAVTPPREVSSGLGHSSRKLRPYFQCHPISVVTTFPLRSILHKPELSGRLAKWAIELSDHDITYQPRTAIKLQVLADFVADFRSGLGLMLEVPIGEVIRQSIRCPNMTNNEAEYEAVIAGLKLALKYGARRVILQYDSQLVVNKLDQIPQAQNIEADGLAKLAVATKSITGEGDMVTLLHSSLKQIEAARYNVVNNDLCKRTFGGPLAKCLGPNQTWRALKEVHEGHYSAHTGNRALIRCLIRASYYWPTMKKEATDFVKSCDNGSQFTGKKTAEFFKKWHIKRILSAPYHPAGNSQVESSSKPILNIMKKKLENAKGLCPEVLPKVLWAYRTSPKMSTWETSYSLVYGTDAMIPVEVGEPSLRYSNESWPSNDENRRQNLDKVKERRDMAYIRMIAQKQQVERYYNKKAKIRPLKVGNYILKAKTQASKDLREGKLGTNWDDPYKITAAASKGSFQLETMEGKCTLAIVWAKPLPLPRSRPHPRSPMAPARGTGGRPS
uniref:Integrase catalytic domain-containing protein n=1 Tax=Nicotiana tabacum TaxID=4097 RepID=A0A1S3Z5A3_TOBAC|nr:PREDICTED: uncharacterized protein LOC107782945 [Nicotiana tabacum]